MKHLWEVEHSYYCEEGGESTTYRYRCLAEFMAKMEDADMDYNLLIRWDWREGAGWDLGEYNGDDNYRHAKLHLYFMHQRHGVKSTSIIDVCRADEPAIIEYLRPRIVHLMALWQPLTGADDA